MLGLAVKSIKRFIAPPLKSESPTPCISLVAEAVKGAGSKILGRKKYELENLPRLVRGNRSKIGEPEPFECEPRLLKFLAEIERAMRFTEGVGEVVGRDRFEDHLGRVGFIFSCGCGEFVETLYALECLEDSEAVQSPSFSDAEF